MIEFRKILYSDGEWHSRFFGFVASIFGRPGPESWQLWYDRGGWTEDYEVFSLVEGEQIVSSIGRTCMQLVINGEPLKGYQLGAVGTRESYRHKGLARQLMDRIISDLETPDQPVILFANSSVTDFYPRFGFERIPQQRSTGHISISGSFSAQVHPCDLAVAEERLRLADLCARARPIRGSLSAQNYYPIALWHLSCRPIAGFWLPEYDAFIAATAENGKLIIHDVIAPQTFELTGIIPRLVSQPITELEFCFNPQDWWPKVEYSKLNDTESPLFIRGPIAKTIGPVQCPELAHT